MFDDNTTDKYIALLQKWLIGKEESIVLTDLNKDKNHSILNQSVKTIK